MHVAMEMGVLAFYKPGCDIWWLSVAMGSGVCVGFLYQLLKARQEMCLCSNQTWTGVLGPSGRASAGASLYCLAHPPFLFHGSGPSFT